MGLPRVKIGEKINLLHLNEQLPKERTFALVKTESMEVIRVALPKGKEFPKHRVDGEITVQCLSGTLTLMVEDQSRELQSGDWLYLAGGQDHSLQAITDAVVLVTILFSAETSSSS